MKDIKKVFIEELKEKDEIKTFFLVAQKRIATTKAGKPYMDILLQDKTGTLSGKLWESADSMDSLIARNDYVLLEGSVESYNGNLQTRIAHVEKVDANIVRLEDYIPTSEYSPEEMKTKLRNILRTIKNPFLLKLIGRFWNNKDFMDKFCRWPAAMKMHHAYGSGLLEHTLSVVEICCFFISQYKNQGVQGDLLLTSAFLHDIGKIEELDFSPSVEYTKTGHLLGHIILSLKFVQKNISAIEDFPVDLDTELEHILISHHGEKQFGSPKVPMNLEAFILHYADNIDAKVNTVRNFSDEGIKKGENFIYAKSLERYIYINEKDAILKNKDNDLNI